jgi:hypothetical protein
LFGKGLSWALLRVAARRAREAGAVGEAEVVAATRRLHARWGALALAAYVPCAWLAAPLVEQAHAGEGLALVAAGVSALFSNFAWHALAVCQLREDWVGYARLTAGGGLIRLCGYVALWLLGGLTVAGAIAAHVVTSALTAAWSLAQAERRIAARACARRASGRCARSSPSTRGRSSSRRRSARARRRSTSSSSRSSGPTRRSRITASRRCSTPPSSCWSLPSSRCWPRARGRAVTREEKRGSLTRATWLAGAVGLLALATWPCASLLVLPFGAAYAPAAELYTVLLLGTVLNALTHPLSVSFFSEDRPGRFVWLHGASLVFLVVADLLVLPGYGALGAAWVKVAMRALQAVLILAYVALDLRE